MKRMLFTLLALLPFAAVAAEPAPVVERFHAALLDSMKQGAALTCAAREQRLAPVIKDSFDTPFLAHFVLRRRWAQMSEEQRTRFTGALEKMVIASYAGNFNSYGGESFSTQGAEEVSGTQATVHTRLNLPSRDPVTFDYVLRQDHDQWRIFNVIADGVSDLALRSAQYEKLYAEQGFDKLVSWIEGQTRNGGC
jgi:phospholipid transport system substrate-binding protein